MKKPVFLRDGLYNLAGATRLELATSGVTGRRSNQTELRPQSKDSNQATFPSGLTGRSNQGIYKLFTLAFLDLLFSCHCAGSIRVFFEIGQLPWSFALGIRHSPLVVTFQSGV